MALFGTNGVRGRLDVLGPALAFDLCASFAASCCAGRIALARDMRITSPMLHAAACSGLMAAGREVADLGLCSSPVAEFAAHRLKAAGLVIVTASHNPAEWNALKFVDSSGVAISHERGGPIEKMALSKSYKLSGWDKAGKSIACPGASKEHAAAVLAGCDAEKIRRRKLRVALDFGNGTSLLSKGVFTSLGMEMVELNAQLDGTFPGRPSEPSEANTQGLCRTVRKSGCDFGVAWDGDSDRVVFADEKGNWIVGDKGFALSARQACRDSARREKLAVTTVATSRVVEDACAEAGGKVAYTKVGAPYISEKMVELGASAVSGGEEVGGIIWPEFSLAKDGIFAAAKMAQMVCDSPLSGLVGTLPEYYNSKAKIEVASAGSKKLGLAAAQSHARSSGGRASLIDGVRVDFDDGWVIARASGTENAMRVFAEGKSKKRAEQLMKEYKDVVENACQ